MKKMRHFPLNLLIIDRTWLGLHDYEDKETMEVWKHKTHYLLIEIRLVPRVSAKGSAWIDDERLDAGRVVENAIVRIPNAVSAKKWGQKHSNQLEKFHWFSIPSRMQLWIIFSSCSRIFCGRFHGPSTRRPVDRNVSRKHRSSFSTHSQ